MRLFRIESLEVGDKLSRPIYNVNGRVLIRQGVALTAKMIERLMEMEISYIYVEDPDTDDIQHHYPISEEVRQNAMTSIKESLGQIRDNGNLSKSYIFEKTEKKMMKVVRNILTEFNSNKQVISLLSDVYTYDDYIYTHSLNVTIYSIALGTELNYNAKQLEQIGFGAILHDVGKMLVPKEILLKKERLTDEEFSIIKKHSEDGFEVLRKTANIPLVAAHCAYQHHERINGSGYPRGIKGDAIHPYAKIIGIADVFDAVTSDRVYRGAMLPHEALEILYAGSGTLFDQEMVESFRRSVAVYPNGLGVVLSDGSQGVIARQNPHLCDRPIVRVLEKDGKRLSQHYEIDLSKELNIIIKDCDTTIPAKAEKI
ncbi:HD-GYP domain-containing protein [Bacillaceae bacterium S4-13-58]